MSILRLEANPSIPGNSVAAVIFIFRRFRNTSFSSSAGNDNFFFISSTARSLAALSSVLSRSQSQSAWPLNAYAFHRWASWAKSSRSIQVDRGFSRTSSTLSLMSDNKCRSLGCSLDESMFPPRDPDDSSRSR